MDHGEPAARKIEFSPQSGGVGSGNIVRRRQQRTREPDLFRIVAEQEESERQSGNRHHERGEERERERPDENDLTQRFLLLVKNGLRTEQGQGLDAVLLRARVEKLVGSLHCSYSLCGCSRRKKPC